ncbi:hypothetical protein J3F84DRAFT_122023 [Trichoderma pleuroticola]
MDMDMDMEMEMEMDRYGLGLRYSTRPWAELNEGSRFGENLLFGSVHFCASDFIARVQVKGPSQGGGVRGEAPQGKHALLVASEGLPMANGEHAVHGLLGWEYTSNISWTRRTTWNHLLGDSSSGPRTQRRRGRRTRMVGVWGTA